MDLMRATGTGLSGLSCDLQHPTPNTALGASIPVNTRVTHTFKMASWFKMQSEVKEELLTGRVVTQAADEHQRRDQQRLHGSQTSQTLFLRLDEGRGSWLSCSDVSVRPARCCLYTAAASILTVTTSQKPVSFLLLPVTMFSSTEKTSTWSHVKQF